MGEQHHPGRGLRFLCRQSRRQHDRPHASGRHRGSGPPRRSRQPAEQCEPQWHSHLDRRSEHLCDGHESEQYSGRRSRTARVLIFAASALTSAAPVKLSVQSGLVDPKMQGRFGELGGQCFKARPPIWSSYVRRLNPQGFVERRIDPMETIMRKRFSGSMVRVAIAGAAVSAGISVSITQTLAQAPVAFATAPAAALKTPWGEPDLQGIWTDETETPFQRPAKYASQE